MKDFEEILKHSRNLMRMATVLAMLVAVAVMLRHGWISIPAWSEQEDITSIEVAVDTSLYGSIDEHSGLVIDEGLDIVKAQCGACHSTKLVAQNRFTREGWIDLIRWMQAEQNLWDLGEQEEIILDYLEKHFSPVQMGRRKNLENIEWYTLNE